MVEFAIASDLHFEFHRDGGRTLVKELPSTEIIIVAGDLDSSYSLWNSLILLLEKYKHVIYVFGNHEFYGSSFQEVRQKLQKLQKRLPKLRLGQLHILDNSFCEIEGQRFVGTTLWFRNHPLLLRKEKYMNDFSEIANASKRIYEENTRAIEFLQETVVTTDVVITHHLPSFRSVHEKWQDSEINDFFVCDMETLIKDRNPQLWVHGHTHESCNYHIGSTQIICNPFGYVGVDENPSFDPNLVIHIE